MNAIKGLILKDLLNLKSYGKTLLIAVVFVCAYGFIGEGYELYVAIMPVMIVGMTVIATFNYDENAKADRFILSLPTGRKDMVNAKYIFIVSSTLLMAMLSVIISLIIGTIVTKEIPNIIPAIFNSTTAFFILAIIQSVQVPNIYKYGAEKGRIILFVVAAAISVIGISGYYLFKSLNVSMSLSSILSIPEWFWIILILVVAAIMYYISCKVSYKIYSKKEL